MRMLRKFVFYSFITGTILVSVFAFWLLSRTPSDSQIERAFPEKSYSVFNSGQDLILYSLVPNNGISDAKTFRGYSILGETKIQKGGFTSFLKRAFVNDIADTIGGGAASFNPRHGMRISDGDNSVDVVICFESGNFMTFYKDKTGKGDIGGKYQNIFDNALKDANVELAK